MKKGEASKTKKSTASANDRTAKKSKSSRGKQRLSLDPPLISPVGRRFRLTNEQIYKLIEFP